LFIITSSEIPHLFSFIIEEVLADVKYIMKINQIRREKQRTVTAEFSYQKPIINIMKTRKASVK